MLCVCVAGMLSGVCACCFAHITVFVQHVSGYVVCLSGHVKMCCAQEGRCAPGSVGGGGKGYARNTKRIGGVWLSWLGLRVCWVPWEGPQGRRRVRAAPSGLEQGW